jgi:hypothetical protein
MKYPVSLVLIPFELLQQLGHPSYFHPRLQKHTKQMPDLNVSTESYWKTSRFKHQRWQALESLPTAPPKMCRIGMYPHGLVQRDTVFDTSKITIFLLSETS